MNTSENSSLELNWQVGWTADPSQPPTRFVPATVPGAVQLDWARAEGWPPYWQGENFRQYDWLADQFWIYRTTLPNRPLAADERLFLVSHGVDYECEVRVNGQPRHRQAGMHTPFEIDLTADAAKGGTLEVVIFPAPPGEAQPLTEHRPRTDCKPPVAYGWDFQPRLIPLGIWDETKLEVRPAAYLRRAELFYTLAPDFSAAELRLEAEIAGHGRVRWQLAEASGTVVVHADNSVTARLDRPNLWWPNGEGEPVLYRLQVELLDDRGRVLDTHHSRVGFRQVRLVMLETGWNGGSPPVTQAEPPTTFEINGRRIFAKGSNWAPPEIFPGTVTADTYRPLLQMAKAAHMNLLRCWGGGFVNKDSFFDLCDELGIMVWQEFTRACNQYADTPAYLTVLDQESRAIIRRLRPHPALVLWCGGNELFNGWSKNTEQDLHMRLVARNCFDLDPTRPYIHTSPIMGIGHGGYWFEQSAWEDSNVFRLYAQSNRTAYCEFGVPATPSAASLRRFIPDAELFPPRRATSWQTHFGFAAWGGDPNSWLMPAILEKYFGPAKDLTDLVRQSQLLQSVGYQAIFEEARRQKPRAAMALNWCFNEPWPCAANNSLIAWPAEPKPALATVAASLRPVLASARIPRFDWEPGAPFSVELFLLNDAPHGVDPLEFVVTLQAGAHRSPLGHWACPGSAAGTNCPGPVLHGLVPQRSGETFELVLDVVNQPELSSSYTLTFTRNGPARQ